MAAVNSGRNQALAAMSDKELKGKGEGISASYSQIQNAQIKSIHEELKKRIDGCFSLLKDQDSTKTKFFKKVEDVSKDVRKNMKSRDQSKFAKSMLALTDLEAKNLPVIEQRGNSINGEPFLLSKVFMEYWKRHDALAKAIFVDLIELEKEVSTRLQAIDLEPILDLRAQLDSVGMGLELPVKIPVFHPHPALGGEEISAGSAEVERERAALLVCESSSELSASSRPSLDLNESQSSAAAIQHQLESQPHPPPSSSSSPPQESYSAYDLALKNAKSSAAATTRPAAAPWGSMLPKDSAVTSPPPPDPSKSTGAIGRGESKTQPTAESAAGSTTKDEILIPSASAAYAPPALPTLTRNNSAASSVESATPLVFPSASAAGVELSPSQKKGSLRLDNISQILSQEAFQQQWLASKFSIKRRGQITREFAGQLTDKYLVENMPAGGTVKLFASGFVQNTIKLFLYANETDGPAAFVTEIIINQEDGSVACSHKCNVNGKLSSYAPMVAEALTFLNIEWTAAQPALSPKASFSQ